MILKFFDHFLQNALACVSVKSLILLKLSLHDYLKFKMSGDIKEKFFT